MFSTLYKFVLAATLIAGAASSPVPSVRGLAARGISSFDGFEGLKSFSGFDNFYGSNNFVGSITSQTIVKQSKEVVCRTETIDIVQQRLLVLQEMAKRIITEQVCEVETQVVTFEQFHASLDLFHSDLLRQSKLQVGFDSEIASHFSGIVSSDGSLSTNDLGFSGQDLGKHTVVVGGSNWNDNTSPASVGSAYSSAVQAASASSGLSSASVAPPPPSSSGSSSDKSDGTRGHSSSRSSAAVSSAASAAKTASVSSASASAAVSSITRTSASAAVRTSTSAAAAAASSTAKAASSSVAAPAATSAAAGSKARTA